MTPEETKEAAERLLAARQYSEAISLLKSATEAFPADESLWQKLVLAASWGGQHDQAVEFANQAIHHHRRSDWLWRQLGNELTVLGHLEEAENALQSSRELNPNAPWLWRYFAGLYQKRKNYEGEAEALERLYVLGEADGNDLNRLGIAWHNHGNLSKALEYYQLSAETMDDAAPLFNMGLVFSHPDIAQDVDAADSYRRVLLLDPDYLRAREQLEAIKQKLIPLATVARESSVDLLRADEHFQFFISPFEALALDNVEDVDAIDLKVIQRLKKRLLQEIELNDGKVSWLNDYALDRSRAIAMDDELSDQTKRQYHWAVFQNKPLLRFLTRGDIEHFLYSDEYFPSDAIELLEEEPEFRAFLSEAFSRQYNLLLSRAIESRSLEVVEALCSGRRWVEPEDEDICFDGMSRRVDGLLEQMHALAEEGEARKIDINEVQQFLGEENVVDLFNLLPMAFRPAQSRLLIELRSLAITCHNKHGDSDLSAQILGLCKLFRFKGVELENRLSEDFKEIGEVVADNRKHSFSAWVRRDIAVEITQNGIRCGADEIAAGEIEAVRWGIYVRTVNGMEAEHSFTLVVSSAEKCATVQWERRGLIGYVKSIVHRKDDIIPIAELSSMEQEVYFHRMIDAVTYHLVPPLIMRLVRRLLDGGTIDIGGCNVDRSGMVVRTGLIFYKEHLVPWSDVDTRMGNGQICAYSRTNREVQVSMSAKDTNNAVILPVLCAAMREHSTPGGQQSPPTQTDARPKQSSRRVVLAGLILVLVIVVIAVIANLDSSTSAPRRESRAPRRTSAPLGYRSPSLSDIPSTGPKTVYRVPSYVSAELEKDRQAIDREKANAERLANQLDRLSREIKRERLYLDETSQFAVDEFNRKVNTHNRLLQTLRSQERLVNQMVTNYNDKLRKYGR
jgi:hypothetical protein